MLPPFLFLKGLQIKNGQNRIPEFLSLGIGNIYANTCDHQSRCLAVIVRHKHRKNADTLPKTET